MQLINDLKAVEIVATDLPYFLIEEKDYPDVFADKFKWVQDRGRCHAG